MDGLDQLFTQKDYSTIHVSIPCYRNGSEIKEHQEDANSLARDPSYISVELACSQAASTDYDLTGQILWPVSVLLAHYLASNPGQSILRGRRVVELGAGCGLPGLVAAQFCQSVVLTDGNEIVLELLETNVNRFKSQQPPQRTVDITAKPLIWGKRSQLEPLLEQPVDVIIAADVVQWPAVIEPLLQTVKALLWSSLLRQPQQQSPPPVFVLGIVNRAQSTYDLFFRLAKESGFVVAQAAVPLDLYLENGIVPKACREFGGRTTEIYELTLLPPPNNNGELPLLLQPRLKPDHDNDDASDDFIVGTSFENTSFLPC